MQADRILFRQVVAGTILLSLCIIPFSIPFLWWNTMVEAVAPLVVKPDVTGNIIANLGRKSIILDLRTQRALTIEKGVVIAEYRISSGAAYTPTPVGKFEIHRKQELRVSNLETPYRMPYYMAFTKSESHGLHALPYLGGNATSSHYWQEALTHIGTPVSHGCVRFLPEDAAKLYEWAEVGTEVYIGYTEEHHAENALTYSVLLAHSRI